MSGSSSSSSSSSSSKNNDDIIDAFTKVGASNRNVVRAHPNATTEQRFALFDGVFDGIESIHADEKAQIAGIHENELQAKDAAHAAASQKKEDVINDLTKKAAEDAATIVSLKAKEKEWTAEKERTTAALKKKDGIIDALKKEASNINLSA